MNNKCFSMVVSVILLFVATAFSQPVQGAAGGKGSLTVIVDGCPSDQGVVKIALVNSVEGYKGAARAFLSTKVTIAKGKAIHVFKDVPFGEYAVTVYHDENGNDQLDKSMFGKPTEAYGFSNNARGLISSPDYKKAAFVLDKAEMTMKIHVE